MGFVSLRGPASMFGEIQFLRKWNAVTWYKVDTDMGFGRILSRGNSGFFLGVM